MNQSYSVPNPPYAPNDPRPFDGGPGRRRITVGTFLIPLGFMLLHLVTISLVFSFFMLVSALAVPPSQFFQIQEALLQNQSSFVVYVMLVAMPILIAVYLSAIFGLRRRGRPYVYFGRPGAGDALRASVMAVGCLGVANLVMLLFSALSDNSPFIAQELENYGELSGSLTAFEVPIFLQILALVVAVPIAEELLFRGIILGELRRALPDWLSITLCGVLFALFHMNFIQTSYVLVAGLALSAVTLWGRSIWLSILLHAVFNFLGSTALVLIGDNEQLLNLFWYLQLACVVLSVFLAIRSYMKRKKDRPASAQARYA